jgi:hypothetical protein
MMEAISSSETSVNFYITRHDIPEHTRLIVVTRIPFSRFICVRVDTLLSVYRTNILLRANNTGNRAKCACLKMPRVAYTHTREAIHQASLSNCLVNNQVKGINRRDNAAVYTSTIVVSFEVQFPLSSYVISNVSLNSDVRTKHCPGIRIRCHNNHTRTHAVA